MIYLARCGNWTVEQWLYDYRAFSDRHEALCHCVAVSLGIHHKWMRKYGHTSTRAFEDSARLYGIGETMQKLLVKEFADPQFSVDETRSRLSACLDGDLSKCS